MNSDQDKNGDSSHEEASPTPQSQIGVFITEGMRVTVPAGGLNLRFSKEGKLESSITLHVGLDMCPYWLEIAFDHLETAESHNKNVHLALDASDDTQLGVALEKEFSASMQAMMAAAIAIDALYAMVKERVVIEQKTLDAWEENGTARYKQIFEVLRQAFSMGTNSAKQMREILKQIMDFRGQAVHPPAKLSAPVLHPELQKGTEWRFVSYRFQNAKPAVNVALSLVAQLATKPKDKYPALKEYCVGLERSVSPLVEKWEQKYGMLYPR